MADAGTLLSREEFNCSICLDLLKDPVALTCGHSYCMICITDCWDQDDQKGVYSCPQCRQTFTPRPVLGKNTMLAEVVEKLKKTKLQAACSDQCYAEPGDVECDVCTGRKYKAIKSCLVCLNSYCQAHFERHEEFHPGKRHKVMDTTRRLQEMICPQHDKLLEIFCRTDEQCICYLCMLDEHKNHDTVSAAAERSEKQKQLEETQGKYQQRIQDRQQEFEELRDAVESHKRSAQAAVEDSERIFTDLIRSIERNRSEVTQLIRDQEKAAVSRAEERLEQLEQEIEDLRRRDAELEQLSHTDHHIHFLQSFQSLSVPPESTDSPSITVSSHLSFDNVGKSVSDLREKLEHFCREEMEKISSRVTYIEIIPTPNPSTKEEFLQSSRGDAHAGAGVLSSNTETEDLHTGAGVPHTGAHLSNTKAEDPHSGATVPHTGARRSNTETEDAQTAEAEDPHTGAGVPHTGARRSNTEGEDAQTAEAEDPRTGAGVPHAGAPLSNTEDEDPHTGKKKRKKKPKC